jgi:protein TonB
MTTQGELTGNANPPLAEGTDPGPIDSVVVREVPVTVTEPETPLINVPEMPEFPGGDAERITFLKNNLTYPEDAKELGVTGTVYLGFIVERDGSISNITILRGIGGGCDEEAVRVVNMMPKWKPGRQQGHAVRVQFTLPIKFTLH